ncbi:MAG: pyruvate, phosphate dikinase [Longimicrobiales bacterium]
MSDRYVYYFGNGQAESGKHQKQLLGGKGANLHEMTRLGLPVPPGFTISTEACLHYLEHLAVPPTLEDEVAEALSRLEGDTGKTFGGEEGIPLLVSVRSGAAISMPGMMDTVLDLGLNDETVERLATEAEDRTFAWDAYRRLVQMYGDVVLQVSHARFEKLLEQKRRERGVESDSELGEEDLEKLTRAFQSQVETTTGQPFPQDPVDQLWGAIRAVFRSWNNDRAIAYREASGIPHDLGTAVTIQAMAFGNLGRSSGSGVAFTRDPSTGENVLYGEFLQNAQGEDVVAGIRDPLPIDDMKKVFPEMYGELQEVRGILEKHYQDMQDFEFTVERGNLYLLQTRTGKRSARAAVPIAVNMVDEELVDRDTAVSRVDPHQLEQLLHPHLDPNHDGEELTSGLAASPGAASGQVVFDPDEAAARGSAGEQVILVRSETSPEAFAGMVASQGILTSRGGMTSHAAVVARGIGKPCITGARTLEIDEEAGRAKANGMVIERNDWITVDGSQGRAFRGKVPTVEPELTDEFQRLLVWADQRRRLRIRANADTPEDARKAREFGAEGIGLCRTEHMFFERDRIHAVREMILAADQEHRARALARLLPMQREDFEGIFRAMDGFPVTIRLLDPPLHEFLPVDEDEVRGLADRTGMDVKELAALVERHREQNPMLGHRGVRLGIIYPEITEMQARAVFEAAVAADAAGVEVRLEVMVPLVVVAEELRRQRDLIRDVAYAVFEETGREVPYKVGTMIEVPRAALTAREIAASADFFSFGTNDLTQTTFGISRDDSGFFLPAYLDQGILPADPFEQLDVDGVGRLVRFAVEEGRQVKQGLSVGICGEHGGNPESVAFCHDVGLSYVSCSPYRVPVARLAAAQAAFEGARKE